MTSNELMAEHLLFKTFPTRTRCIYEKKHHIHCNIFSNTDQFQIKCKRPSGEVCGKSLALGGTQCEHRFLQKYTVKISSPFCLSACKAKIVFSHTPHFPYVFTESQSSANLCKFTGISTLNSSFLCFQQLQTGTEQLKMEQRDKRLQKYLTLEFVDKSHSTKLFFLPKKVGNSYVRECCDHCYKWQMSVSALRNCPVCPLA